MQFPDGDAGAEIVGAAGGKHALVADVMDREYAARRSEDMAVPGVGVLSSSGASAVCQSFACTICGAKLSRWQHSNAARVSTR